MLFGNRIRKAVGLAVLTIMVTITGGHAQREFVREEEVKAAFLYNFAKFIEWPEEVLAKSKATFLFCVIGEDPFAKILEEGIGGKIVHEMRVEIRQWEKGKKNGCQVLFVSAWGEEQWSAIRSPFQDVGVLVVGERERFAQEGGIINFVMAEDKVRFEINLDAAERAHLKINVKLLSLAILVRDRGR